MTAGKAYAAIGGIFERLNKDCGYSEWSQYLINALKTENAGTKGADIGCGNGYFTRALERAGYEVTGVDNSPEMLSAALELSRKEGVRAPFVLGDITKLNLGYKADFIIAVNDVLNYVPQKDIEKTLKKVRSNLKKGGIFIFDISTEYKLKEILGNNLFCEDEEDYSLIWFNTLKDDSVEMNLTLFTKTGENTYTRADERHIQYIHGESGLIKTLEDIGFAVKREGHLGGFGKERINFICKKI